MKNQFPINEPAEGRKNPDDDIWNLWRSRSQHIALLTDDIINAITKLRQREWNS
jgi:4-hydroxyphenylpyruvate dioxygenase-like putative hemolysin